MAQLPCFCAFAGDENFIAGRDSLDLDLERHRFVEGGSQRPYGLVYNFADSKHRRHLGNYLHLRFLQEKEYDEYPAGHARKPLVDYI